MGTTTPPAPATKVRSPNYPVMGLREAAEKIKPIWEHQHRHPTDRITIAKILGYGSLNGASMALISALTKYGLLEAAGRDQLRVSPLAVDLLVHQPGEPERSEAVRQAAFLPALFHELHERFGDDPPGDHGLRTYLVKRGFNTRTVDGVIRSYRDTLDFLSEEDTGIDVESEGEPEPEVPPMQAATPVQTIVSPTPNAWGMPTPSEPVPISGQSQQVRRLSVPLSRKVTAEVVFLGGEVTPRELDALRKYLEVWEGFLGDDAPDDDGVMPDA